MAALAPAGTEPGPARAANHDDSMGIAQIGIGGLHLYQEAITQRLYGPNLTVQQRMGTTSRGDILNKIQTLYPTHKATVPWYGVCNNIPGSRMIWRHRLNKYFRQHTIITETYVEWMVDPGLMPGVGGEPWLTPASIQDDADRTGCLMAVAFGSRADAWYLADARHGSNPNVIRVRGTGLQGCLIYGTAEQQLPDDVLTWLMEEHNRWRKGAEANIVQLLFFCHESEGDFLTDTDAKNVKQSKCPSSGPLSWNNLMWEFVGRSDRWKNRFGDSTTQEFFDKGRYTYRALTEEWQLYDDLVAIAGKHCNFKDPRFKAGVFFKICHRLHGIF